MTVDSRVRPAHFEDLSHLDSIGRPRPDGVMGDDAGLPAWAHEILVASRQVPAPVRPTPVELPSLESIQLLAETDATPEPSAAESAAADAAREVSISFELGHRAGFDHGRREGHDEGRRAGLEAGRLEALRAGHDATAELLGSLRAAAAEHTVQLGSLADAVARSATELALGIAEAVLQRELSSAVDPGADAIRRAAAALPHTGATLGAAVVRLHPDDLARLVADPSDLLVGTEVTLVADAAVEHGACVLDAGSTRVDTTVSSALARVREVLAP